MHDELGMRIRACHAVEWAVRNFVLKRYPLLYFSGGINLACCLICLVFVSFLH